MTNTLEMKQQILKEISIADDSVIREVYAVLHSTMKENQWHELPVQVQNDINEGIRQANKGEVIAHEDIMKKYKSWLSK